MNRIAIILLSLSLIALQGKAQTAEDSILNHYLEVAAKNNPGLKASFNSYLAALQKIPQVGTLPDPTASMDFFLKPMELLNGNQVGTISLMQMFPWFGTLKTAQDEALQMANAQYNQFDEEKADLFFRVKSTWYQLGKTQQEIQLAQEYLSLLESIEQLTLVRYQSPSETIGSSAMPPSKEGSNVASTGSSNSMSGMSGSAGTSSASQSSAKLMAAGGMTTQPTGMTDVLRIKMEILNQKDQQASLLDRLATERVAFNVLLNQESDEAIELPSLTQTVPLTIPTIQWKDSIMIRNPMIAMLQSEQKAYTAMEEKARKMSYPMFGIGLNYMVIQKQAGNTSMMNGSDMVMPMINFTIPVYRKKYTAMQKEAQLRQEASMQQSNQLERSLELQYEQLLQELKSAWRRIDLYSEQAYYANKTAELLMSTFTSSGNGFEEVLRMQYSVIDYKFRHVEAIADYNTAVAKAEKLMNALRIKEEISTEPTGSKSIKN